jgi:hypothetical protein
MPLSEPSIISLAMATPLQEVSNFIRVPIKQLLTKYPSIIRRRKLTSSPTHRIKDNITTGNHWSVSRFQDRETDTLKLNLRKKLIYMLTLLPTGI